MIIHLLHSSHLLFSLSALACPSVSSLPDSPVPAAEIATGKGILGQVALETGVPQSWVEIGLLVLLGYNVVAVSQSPCGSFACPTA